MNRGSAIPVLLQVWATMALAGCAAWQPASNVAGLHGQATVTRGQETTVQRPAASPVAQVATAPATTNTVRHGPSSPGLAPTASRSTTVAQANTRVVRAQDGDPNQYPNQNTSGFDDQVPGTDSYQRNRMPVSQVQYQAPAGAQPPAYTTAPPPGTVAPIMPPPGTAQPYAAQPYATQPYATQPYATQPYATQPYATQPYATQPYATQPPVGGPVVPLIGPQSGQPYVNIDPTMSTPVDVYVEETQTGRFMFGAGVNSDAGVTGQIVIDERNFDITRFPTSFRDFADGTAFRGGGQGFRLEAMPGDRVQRYLASFTEPYLLGTQLSLNLSGFFYNRRYYDWDEQRLGGRVALGYRLTHDLSVATSLRLEDVEISDPRVLVPQLAEVLGDNSLYSVRFSLTHDTRDIPFSPTEGHLVELSYEQAFGDFDYPRGDFDYRQYFLIRERPDGSGRHTLAFLFRLGFTGSQTPIFERYFAGGYSTLRGFDFRGASPMVNSVRVGGDFLFLGSAEYVFPLTADDMLKGALFVDYGTVEESIKISSKNYRVAPGFGIRVNVPALGPAPLAFDFAFPLAQAETDEERIFSFFFGVGR